MRLPVQEFNHENVEIGHRNQIPNPNGNKIGGKKYSCHQFSCLQVKAQFFGFPLAFVDGILTLALWLFSTSNLLARANMICSPWAKSCFGLIRAKDASARRGSSKCGKAAANIMWREVSAAALVCGLPFALHLRTTMWADC